MRETVPPPDGAFGETRANTPSELNYGSGSPESVYLGFATPTPSLYVDLDTPALYVKTSGNGTRTGWEEISGGGGSLWETVTTPTSLSSFDTGGAVGTWTNPSLGVFRQTDNTIHGDGLLVSNEDIYGMAFDLSCDLRLDGVDDPITYFNDGMFAAGLIRDPADGTALAAVGVADGNADAKAFGDSGGASSIQPPYNPPVDVFHTYRVVVFGATAFAYYDGDLFAWGIVPIGNFWASLPGSPLGFIGVVGAATFKNLTLKRIPIPA